MNSSKSPLFPALVLAAALGCEDLPTCNALGTIDTLVLTFQRDEWSPATYDIELAFEDHGTPYTVTCQAHVPVLEPVELDGSTRFVAEADDDAVLASPRNPTAFPCTSKPTGHVAEGTIGRALSVMVWGTPRQLDVSVRDAEGLVLEKRVKPEYGERYRNGGPECGAQLVGSAELVLE